jgi:hypothetical protein
MMKDADEWAVDFWEFFDWSQVGAGGATDAPEPAPEEASAPEPEPEP